MRYVLILCVLLAGCQSWFHEEPAPVPPPPLSALTPATEAPPSPPPKPHKKHKRRAKIVPLSPALLGFPATPTSQPCPVPGDKT